MSCKPLGVLLLLIYSINSGDYRLPRAISYVQNFTKPQPCIKIYFNIMFVHKSFPTRLPYFFKIPKSRRRDIVLIAVSITAGYVIAPIFLNILLTLIIIAAVMLAGKIAYDTGLIEALLNKHRAYRPILPARDYFSLKPQAINDYWRIAFYHNLKSFTLNSEITTDQDNGLIYCFIIDDQVRYIGQTREKTLRQRMTKQQADSHIIGYNDYIKRNMLDAASKGLLKIQTQKIDKSELDNYEISLIQYYAPTNRLWNQKHNKHFSKENFY